MAPQDVSQTGGSHDGSGSADHDVPFAGYSPNHFNTWQMLRLLLLRSEVLEGKLGRGRFAREFRRRFRRAPRSPEEASERGRRAA